MSEGLGDFFKLIAEDKKKKKEEFNELVGDLGLDSLFSEIGAEKKKIKEAKEKAAAKLVEEEKKKREQFDKLVGGSVDDLFQDLIQAKKDVVEDKKQEEKRQKQVLNSFENFLTKKIEDIEEIKEEIKEEIVVEEPVVEEVVEEVVEDESLVEKSLGLLSEPSEVVNADQNFATLEDLQKHYREFLGKIQQQLSTLGGGGIEDAPKTGGPYVRQGQKWVVSSGGGGVGAGGTWSVDTVGINTTKSVGIGTTAKDGISLYVQGDARITGILTVGESSVTINGEDDKIIIGTGTTITEGGNAEFVGVVTATGIHLDDGDKINMGDGDDFQIFHHSNGTGIIQNAGSGQLQIRSDEIRLLNQATDEDYAFFRDDGAVELYYDDTKRFETTGYGVTVTGISSAQNVSIANTFTYPEYITGGTVPRAIKSQGGYDRTDGFADRQTATNASQDPADYIEYTQEYADSGTWLRFGITTEANQANDNQWWGETNPNYDNTKGLFGGLTAPAGVDHFFDFSENTAFNNAQTTGSLKYTQALGSFSLKECQVGDLVLARFDLNVMPMVTNTTIEVGLIYSNRNSSDTITFTFPLTTTPFTYGSGTVGRGYLIRPTVTAYMANQEDVNSRSLLAIKADNPVLVNPIGVLFTIQR